MPLKWSEVIQKPEYQSLSDKEKDEARQEYFQDVIVPQIKPAEVNDTWNEFSADAIKIETDYKQKNGIPSLTSILDAQPLSNINAEQKFDRNKINIDRNKLAEFQAEQERLNNPQDFTDRMKSAALKGVEGSATNAIAARTNNDILKYNISRDPQGILENAVSGGAQMLTDLPLFLAGEGIVGAGLGETGTGIQWLDRSLRTAGGFSLPSTIGATERIAAQKGGIGIEDIPDVAKEFGKSFGTGLLFGGVNSAAAKAASGIESNALAKLAEFGMNVPGQTAVSQGMNLATGGKFSMDNLGADIGMNTVFGLIQMKAPREFSSKLEEKGYQPEQLAKNVDPVELDAAKTPQEVQTVIEKAAVKTEYELAEERRSQLQQQIINKQIEANYKPGKTPEEVIQVNQIPEQYRPLIADQLPDGSFKVRDDILRRVDERTNPNLNPFDDSGIPFKSNGEQLVEQYKQLKEQGLAALDNLKSFEAQKDKLYEQEFQKEFDKRTGNYRRYENLPNIREQMDKVINHVKDTMTWDEKFNVVNDPSSLMNYIDTKESGYNALSKKFQDAVQKEIVGDFIRETNVLPQYVISDAAKVAETRVNKQHEAYARPVEQIRQAIDQVKQHPDFQQMVREEQFRQLPEEQKQAYINEMLKPIDEAYAQQIENAKQEYVYKEQPEVMKVLGEAPDLPMNHDARAVFGADHVDDFLSFFRVKNEEAQVILEHANLLTGSFNQKFDFNNASRVISRLGKPMEKLFVEPLRQAEHNFIVEDTAFKEWNKRFKKDFNTKERQEIELHLLGQQKEAWETILKMWQDEKLPVEYKKFNELSEKQQNKVTEIRNLMDTMLERINAGRRIAGIDELPQVDNYSTFLRKFSMLEELGYDPYTVPAEILASDIITEYQTKSFAFRFGKERNLASTKEFELDSAYVLDKYMTQALRTTHMTPVVGRLREMINSSDRFMLTNPGAYNYLSGTLDYISGKKLSEAKALTNWVANHVNRNLGVFILSWNLNSIAIQPTALVNSLAKIAPLYIGKGLKDFMSKDMREFAMQKSKVLKARMHEVTVQEMKQGLYGKYGKAKEKVIDTGTLPLRYLDLKTAQVTWLSAFRHATERLQLTGKEAVLFADDVVIKSQGSASRIDLAPVQRTPLGKSFTLFNTFVINNWNMLIEDVAGIRKVNKLQLTDADAKTVKDLKGSEYKIVPIGEGKANVYKSQKMLPTSEALEKIAAMVVASAISNTAMELMGVKPPTPAPISAAYEALAGQSWVDAIKSNNPGKKEGQIADALIAALQEFASVVPVIGGAPRYGGSSLFGAVGGLLIETFDSLAGKPGSKPALYLVGKWSGVPGGQQVYKLYKALAKEKEQEQQNMMNAMHPERLMQKQMRQANPEYYNMQKEINKQMRGY